MVVDLPVAITVAGSDSGGGAGIQADLLTFAALGVHGTSAITCLTAQNPDGVSAVEAMSPDFVREQLDQLVKYFDIGALKTGMLFNSGIVLEVARFLAEHREIQTVVDPVMVATSGAVLLQDDAVEAIAAELLPKATLFTPNLDEAKVLLGWRPGGVEDMTRAARELSDRFGTSVLVKGGHLEGEEVVDILQSPGGEPQTLSSKRIGGVNTHGSGCTLSAAIAAQLAKGERLAHAWRSAHAYLQRGMLHPVQLAGQEFINHHLR